MKSKHKAHNGVMAYFTIRVIRHEKDACKIEMAAGPEGTIRAKSKIIRFESIGDEWHAVFDAVRAIVESIE